MVRRRRRMAHEEPQITPGLLRSVREVSRPLRNSEDLSPLMDRIGDARFVLLGEASHGTHEFYTWRAEISRRLIEEYGFSFIAVEGDWPDCYRVNRFVKGLDDGDETARDALQVFSRWPTWMWANEEIAELAQWMRDWNQRRPIEQRAGFFGLDVYSLWDSLYQVLGYLGNHRPDLLASARKAFQCFEPYGEDVQDYARATSWADESCEEEVVTMLTEMRQMAKQAPDDDGRDATFNAEQNALVVTNAERYYRAMVRGGPESWNVRDRHMMQTLCRLMHHHGPQSKTIVWEHNTHIGDARYTDMVDDGMVNVGQLVRENYLDEGVVLVGFATHHGSVIAGDAWDAPMRRMPVPEARPGSWDDVLFRAADTDQILIFDGIDNDSPLMEERGQRAIGVVYRPQYERHGNYVPTILPRRYDALLYLRETEALRPLESVVAHRDSELPETFPTGM